MIDFLDIERGYATFYRKLLHILREKDIESFRTHIASHPREAGKFSHVLGLSKELVEIEMYKTILRFKNLKDLHQEAIEYLSSRGIKVKRNDNKRSKGNRGKKQRGPSL